LKTVRVDNKIIINLNKVIGGESGSDFPNPVCNLIGETVIPVITVNAQLTGLFIKGAFDIGQGGIMVL